MTADGATVETMCQAQKMFDGYATPFSALYSEITDAPFSFYAIFIFLISMVGDGGFEPPSMVSETAIIGLRLLDSAGVVGSFTSTFVFPLNPYDDNPRFDLDRESSSLVKSYGRGKFGKTYPDMTWDPKESFWAVADYYGRSFTIKP